MAFIDDREIHRIVAAFEDATIGRDDWRHAEHMIVGMYYLDKYGLTAARNKMKEGILNLLTTGFGIDLSKEMPYHETMTMFWLDALEAFRAGNPAVDLATRVKVMLEKFDKDYSLKYYSRERLFSDEARRVYIEPDIKPLHEVTSVSA